LREIQEYRVILKSYTSHLAIGMLAKELRSSCAISVLSAVCVD
jgi:hypothetical protein